MESSVYHEFFFGGDGWCHCAVKKLLGFWVFIVEDKITGDWCWSLHQSNTDFQCVERTFEETDCSTGQKPEKKVLYLLISISAHKSMVEEGAVKYLGECSSN